MKNTKNEIKKLENLQLHEVSIIHDDRFMNISAMKVPGGWLYITRAKPDSVSTFFVPEEKIYNMKIKES